MLFLPSICCNLKVLLSEVDPLKIEASASIQPDLIITKEGEEYSVTHIAKPDKNFTVTFIPGQANKLDPFSSGDIDDVRLLSFWRIVFI